MKKQIVFILTIVLMPLIAGIYGAIHDQISYTISPEYFTKFKYPQFGFVLDQFGGERITVAIIGFLATWWMGIFIGIAHGLIGFIHDDPKKMKEVIVKATLITLVVAAITGLIGLAYGKFYLSNKQLDWEFPDNLLDMKSYIMAGSMHNFSYLGGLLGIFAGITYQILIKRKANKA